MCVTDSGGVFLSPTLSWMSHGGEQWMPMTQRSHCYIIRTVPEISGYGVWMTTFNWLHLAPTNQELRGPLRVTLPATARDAMPGALLVMVKNQTYWAKISTTHFVFHEANRYYRNRGKSCTVMQKKKFINVHERYIEHYKLYISVGTLDYLSKIHRHVWWKETSDLNSDNQITNLRSKFSYNFACNSDTKSWNRKIAAECNKTGVRDMQLLGDNIFVCTNGEITLEVISEVFTR